jgi:hypothetical protein
MELIGHKNFGCSEKFGFLHVQLNIIAPNFVEDAQEQ